uniref:Uncharacterized protein n=1 Tax=Glossina austeni TaxID=7395 RepID=A0A1A9VHA8_GLOAU
MLELLMIFSKGRQAIPPDLTGSPFMKGKTKTNLIFFNFSFNCQSLIKIDKKHERFMISINEVSFHNSFVDDIRKPIQCRDRRESVILKRFFAHDSCTDKYFCSQAILVDVVSSMRLLVLTGNAFRRHQMKPCSRDSQ